MSCLHTLAELSPGPALAVVSGRITYLNEPCSAMLGVTARMARGATLESVFPDFDFERMLQSALSSKRALTREQRIFLPSGKECWLWAEVTPMPDTEEPAALVKIFDVSAQRRLQLAMLRELRKTALDDVWLFDDQRRVLYADVEEELRELVSRPDFDPFDLLDESSYASAEVVFRQARETPGESVSISLNAWRSGHLVKLYADVMFLPDTFTNGHFFCCTRFLKVSNAAIIDRLHQVYGVGTDAELAERMGASTGALSRARRNGKISPRWIFNAWERRGVSMDWLVTGKGDRWA